MKNNYNTENNRYLNGVLAFLIIFIHMISIINISFAQEKNSFKNREIDRQLWEVRQYSGIPEYYPPDDTDLGISINREVGIVMVLRLSAYDNKASKISDEETNNILSKYSDANKISPWARKTIAYAVKNKFVFGVSENKIGLKESFTGKMFCTIALRSIGYNLDIRDYKNACTILAEKGGLLRSEADNLNDKELIKDDIIGLLYELLKAERADKKTVIQKLIEDGIANNRKAKEYNLIE